MHQHRIECNDIRTDIEKRDGVPPRYNTFTRAHPPHPMLVSFTDVKGDNLNATIHPAETRLICYPAMTALAPGDPATGRVSDV